MSVAKPYSHIPIAECGEALQPIPDRFARVNPHPYQSLGADYGDRSPFMLREGAILALIKAETYLQCLYPNWRLLIFDAYRPIAVQKFMVDYTTQALSQKYKLALDDPQLQELVFTFWAVPSDNPLHPPPHSTAGAIDLTLMKDGIPIDMGAPIDESSERSFPDYFQTLNPEVHHHRQILLKVMTYAGWVRHPQEWWHFSIGDQSWAWQKGAPCAYYGGI